MVLTSVRANEAFKKCKPEGVVFVISRTKSGAPNGMAASWWVKCSEVPPTIAVAIWEKANTHKLISKSKEFVIAVPNKGIEKELLFFGTTQGKKVDKFKKTNLKTQKAKYVKVPLIRDATFNFECKLYKKVKIGECTLFIGKVLAGYHNKKRKVLLLMRKKGKKRVFREF